MKKVILLAAFSLTLVTVSQAQIEKGNFLINVGIGAGYYHAGGGVPFIASGEYAFTDKLSIGPYIGYTSWTYKAIDARYTFLDLGVRGSYHFNELFQIDNEKLDIYGGGFIGVLTSSYSYDGPGTFNDTYGGGLRLGIHAGARYYFAEKVAGYGELGYGISSLSIGLTFRL